MAPELQASWLRRAGRKLRERLNNAALESLVPGPAGAGNDFVTARSRWAPPSGAPVLFLHGGAEVTDLPSVIAVRRIDTPLDLARLIVQPGAGLAIIAGPTARLGAGLVERLLETASAPGPRR